MGQLSPNVVLRYVVLVSILLGLLCYTIAAQFPVPARPQPGPGILEAPAAPINSKSQSIIPVNSNAARVDPGSINTLTDETCLVSDQYPPNIYQWCGLITRYANQYGLEPDLLAALILVESGGQAEILSRNGAVGLMQIMPRDGLAADFQCPNGPCFANRPTIQELKNPEFNLDYGSKMLARLIKKRGSLREALFAYGPAGVGYTYADKVLSTYQAYKK